MNGASVYMENKKQTLYLECRSGISGDMTVAALLDLGADQEALMHALHSLPVDGFEIRISQVKKNGLAMYDFDVVLDDAHDNHDHDMEYLHGHPHDHPHAHDHDHAPESQKSHGHHHSHEHRGLPEILHILDHAELTDGARNTAVRIFEILAEAEAKAHGVPVEEVHFHEVGAVDSIVDIVAAAVCLDDLQIDQVIVPVLCEGQGTIRCQHGILPVPVPAVLNIVQAHQIALQVTEVQGELVTPTGAAIVAAVRTSDRLPGSYRIEKIGMGAGKRQYECPGMLRAMLITSSDTERDLIWKLETNVDDCNGECLGYTLDRLMEAGARDVNYMPVYMKKNRPGYQLNVICTEEQIGEMEQIIFEETTTIGIRRVPMERTILQREIRIVQTPLGEAKVKVCRVDGRERYFPEYNSIVELCRGGRGNYQEVYQMIQNAACPFTGQCF